MKNRIRIIILLILHFNPVTLKAQDNSNVDSIRAENLVFMGNVYGMIRHFYPNKSLDTFNFWEGVLAHTSNQVIKATTLEEGINLVYKNFKPLCPDLQIEVKGKSLNNALNTPKQYDSVLVKENWGWGDHGENATRIEFLYHSALRTYPKNVLPKEYPRPGEKCIKNYNENITIEIPLVTPISPELDLETLQLNDSVYRIGYSMLNVQIGTLIELSTVMQHFYPYLKQQKINNDSILFSSLLEVVKGVDSSSFFNLLERVCASYNDGHCAVMPYTSFKDWPDYVPGIRLNRYQEKVIISFIKDSIPSVTVGDEVLSINNVPISDFVQNKYNRVSGATSYWSNHVTFKELLCGNLSSELMLTIKTEKDTISASLKREYKLYKLENLINDLTHYSYDDSIRYINLTNISDSFLKVLIKDSLSNASGIILDVRGYPRAKSVKTLLGHLHTDTLYSQPWYINNYIYPYQSESNRMVDSLTRWVITPQHPQFKIPVVFLINNQVISGAETYMSIVDHYNLGTIIGENTAGTNGNVNAFKTYDSYLFWFTGMTVLKYDNSTFHGVGIAPFIKVTPTIKGLKENEDYFIMEAVEHIRQKNKKD